MATKRKPTAEGQKLLEDVQGMSDEDFAELARQRKSKGSGGARGRVIVLEGEHAESFLERLGFDAGDEGDDDEGAPAAELEDDDEDDDDDEGAHPAGKKRKDPAPPQRHRYFG